ncbi:Kelch repeat-containing protein [Aquimarina algiphila]|uniref:Kelch repeat-containing protein n=1 Tax=Aquimarina algiphila TaxID=2047982 RepID=UPI002490FBA2|nr:kelch repeat-containing protein [Aquimarina algiphila]
MKTKNKLANALVMLTILIFVASCGSDDNNAIPPDEISEPDPIQENTPPESFNLIAVADNEIDVDVRPNFSWEAAKDPDGDPVTYELHLTDNYNDFLIHPNTENQPNPLYSENFSFLAFQATESLGLLKDYYWRVVAKDNRGGRRASTIHSFRTRGLRIPDGPITSNTQFNGSGRTSVVFDDKIWVIGGGSSDVRYSENGINWTESTSNAQFPWRAEHTSVVFDDKMWVIGGSGTFVNDDVWYSENGKNWTEVTTSAQFSWRTRHTSVVFDDKMWVIGGLRPNGERLNDVWYSEDGENWIEATANAQFSARINHTSVVFDGKVWVIGGSGDNLEIFTDVWYSKDGKDWTQATANAQFSSRRNHTSVVFDDKIWVIGGGGNGGSLNDVWYSANGTEWNQVANDASFPERSGHTSVVFDNKIWVIGGQNADGPQNNVWALD